MYRLLVPVCLVVACVILHAIGSILVMRRANRSLSSSVGSFLPAVWLLVQIVLLILLVHVIEILLWASFFAGTGLLADLETACYFSAITYTTLGYGDVVLPTNYRLVAGLEALTGIIMCGWSTALLFSVIVRVRGPLPGQAHHASERNLEGKD